MGFEKVQLLINNLSNTRVYDRNNGGQHANARK